MSIHFFPFFFLPFQANYLIVNMLSFLSYNTTVIIPCKYTIYNTMYIISHTQYKRKILHNLNKTKTHNFQISFVITIFYFAEYTHCISYLVPIYFPEESLLSSNFLRTFPWYQFQRQVTFLFPFYDHRTLSQRYFTKKSTIHK